MSALDVTLRHRFGGFTLDVTIAAPAGVTALFGRSGSGKTSIVRGIAGLLRPDTGRVAIGGRVLLDTQAGIRMPVARRHIGYVFQDDRLFPHMTVRRNLAYGRRAGRPAIVGEDDVIDMLDLGSLLDRRPAGLSGGERQRVAIGRALLSAPSALLMDEPLASLDQARKSEIMPCLERLRDATDIPIVYVSHAISEVARLATTLVALDGGRVVRAGPVADVLADPEAVLALGVRDAGALIGGRVQRHHDDGLTELAGAGGVLFVPSVPAPVGSRLRLRIAADDVILSRARPEGLSALNILAGTVCAIHPGSGPGAVVQVLVGHERILARITKRSLRALALEVGTPCHAVLKSVAVARDGVGPDPAG